MSEKDEQAIAAFMDNQFERTVEYTIRRVTRRHVRSRYKIRDLILPHKQLMP